MSLLYRLFNRPKRPADGSVCPACGSSMIRDSRVVRPRIGVEITQEYFHCTNRECGHTIPVPGESLTLPYLWEER